MILALINFYFLSRKQQIFFCMPYSNVHRKQGMSERKFYFQFWSAIAKLFDYVYLILHYSRERKIIAFSIVAYQ